jgi:adenine C2-methylase RlmN of 23S rRNA A2503 and tRNA A37
MLITEKKSKSFLNGVTYALQLADGRPIEVVDTFLPISEKSTLERHTNALESEYNIGSRSERWLIGISTMSGCPIKCPFCAVTGVTERYGVKNLTADEMMAQIEFVLSKNPDVDPLKTKQLKIQTTRMGEPSMNFEVLSFIRKLHVRLPNAKIFVSTVGIQNSFLDKLLALKNEYGSEDFIQLQFSVHTTDANHRRVLQPNGNLMTFAEINEFGRKWNDVDKRKITLNFAITGKNELSNHLFDVDKLEEYFDKDVFFVKLSPLNDNTISEKNNLVGVIPQHNLA